MHFAAPATAISLSLTDVLRRIGAPSLSAEESVVRPSLTPLDAIPFSSETAAPWTAELLLTSTVATFSLDELPSADVAEEITRGIRLELPPLPTARMWFEFTANGRPGVYEVGAVRVIGIGVTGTSESWAATVVSAQSATPDTLDIEVFEVAAGRHASPPTHTPEAISVGLPLLLAQMVSAHGTKIEPIEMPRQQRRSFERDHLHRHPTVYRVVLGGRRSTSTDTHSGRSYSCRWLVRGHWRRYASGTRVWVRAHIKGPADAPWKGRPVYTAS